MMWEFPTGYEFDTNTIVLFYDSLITPLQHIEMELADTSKRTVIKKRNVRGYEIGTNMTVIALPSRHAMARPRFLSASSIARM